VAGGPWVLAVAIFARLTIKQTQPSLDKGINGARLLAVVAAQSIAALSALLAAWRGQPVQLELNFPALSMWLWGGMLHVWMMSLIVSELRVSITTRSRRVRQVGGPPSSTDDHHPAASLRSIDGCRGCLLRRNGSCARLRQWSEPSPTSTCGE
jgi:hypothetical protein